MWKLCCIALFHLAKASYVFYHPPAANSLGPLEVWQVGSVQEVHWSTNLSSYEVWLWQQWPEGPGAEPRVAVYQPSPRTDGSGDASFNWTVQTYGANLTYSNRFYFWINANEPGALSSDFFNISDDSITTSTILSTTTATTAIVSSTISSTSTTPTPTPISTSAAINSSSNVSDSTASSPSTNSTVIGLGVGLGVGIPLILAFGIWFAMKKKIFRSTASTPSREDYDDSNTWEVTNDKPPVYSPAEIYKSPTLHFPAELSGQRAPVELPGNRFSR